MHAHRHHQEGFEQSKSKASDAIYRLGQAHNNSNSNNNMKFSPTFYCAAALSLTVLLVLHHSDQAAAHSFSRRSSASASTIPRRFSSHSSDTVSSRRRVVSSSNYQDFEAESLSFLNHDDTAEDIRTIQPCRSIGNTLLRGACLRIASDLSVSFLCLFSVSCCYDSFLVVSDTHPINHALFFSCDVDYPQGGTPLENIKTRGNASKLNT